VIAAAAYYLGYDSCTEKPEEGQKILELLEKQKPAVKIYSRGHGRPGRQRRGDDGAHVERLVPPRPRQAAEHRLCLPREGVNLWGDNFAVPKGAKHPENGKLFLNWMMDSKNAAEASNFTGYNNAIANTDQYLKEDLRKDPAFNTPEDMVARFRR